MSDPIEEKPRKRGRPKNVFSPKEIADMEAEELEKYPMVIPPDDEPFELDDLETTEEENDEFRSENSLVDSEKKLIDNAAGRLSLDEIIAEIGGKRKAIIQYMTIHNLLGEEDLRNERTKRVILSRLHNSPGWEMIKRAFDDDELVRFEDEWCVQVMQLDQNLLPTEETQLKQSIALAIQIDRSYINEREAQQAALVYAQRLDELKDEVNELKLEYGTADSDMRMIIDSQIKMKQAEMDMNMQLQTTSKQLLGAYSKERKDNLNVYSKLLTDLKATREKRVDSFKISDRTWSKMLMDIKENPRLKKQMGCMGYVAWLATERMKAELRRDYMYADGESHPMIMSADSPPNKELLDEFDKLYKRQLKEN